ncbi:potassium-transporting ATPase subunit KdpA [Acidiferrobacter thiooxydans]|uniref:potassium-transporting ATPase subunit KdpA n=1 Tax=Acidiferrobacter thiooxydans TaxID=163359 RepID=UPI0008268301|nr:potassium-transporting ATPase subunit KdpA [Acidiferrobacter thiooxydans]UEO00551.1 potassium-transporting ATPase subunit KdpA [Acidiferrobacter thiooxydans]
MTSPVETLVAVLVATILLALPLGAYMARVYSGETFWATRALGPVERLFYRLAGIHPDEEMDWKRYAIALLIFNLLGMVFLYGLLLWQHGLPLNPEHFPGVTRALAFNTAASFVTNTNWQAYGGESTMSYLSQMLGLAVQNFLSAATGIVIVIAIIRGIIRAKSRHLGNFWVDMTRTVLYVLLPLSVILGLVLLEQGAPQTLGAYVQAHLIAPFTSGKTHVTHQTIALGPVASQEAIKQLGNNGGGFFNANSAHPFESPTAFTNYLQMIAMILIPTALVFMFGHMVKDRRQSIMILSAMLVLFVPLALASLHYDLAANSLFHGLPVSQATTAANAGGGNMVGVEDRFGAGSSALFGSLATATSTGAANSAYDSFMPLSGLVNLFFMQLGETAFGGVGSGLATMLAFVVFAVFLGGLMIGRTPEYLGKKIESFEIKMVSLSILVMPLLVLIGTSVAVAFAAGRAGPFNPGAHGFSEILYAFTSASNNNGSAFGGLSADTTFYNVATGLCILFGRYWSYLPLLALGGSLAAKQRLPASAGTLGAHGPLFVGLVVGVILLVGALNFFPALGLGPIAEQLTHVHALAASK